MTRTGKAFLGVILAVAVALPYLLGSYRLQIMIFVICYSMLALAFSLSMKVGLPRFDMAAWWGVGAYTTAILMLKVHMSFWLTIPIGVVLSLILGVVVFSLSIPRGMMVFMMFGMVFAMAIQQILGTVSFFGGWGGTASVDAPSIGALTFVNKTPIYYFGLGLLVLNVVVYQLLYRSKIGRSWNAIGSSIKLAQSLGIDVVKYRLANVLVGNAFLAIAGSYFVMFSRMAIPSSFGFDSSVNVMLYVVLGGLGYYLAGPIVGALVITLLTESMRVVSQYQPIVSGAVVVLILIFAPGGLLGLFHGRVKSLTFAGIKWVGRRSYRAKTGESGQMGGL
jgi:branched-chain amino acid transport system permease protein